MAHEWLTPEDSTLWCAETATAPLQVGALCLFEAGPLLDTRGRVRRAVLRRHSEAALDRVPRLRRVLVTPPFGVGRPAWVDDPDFDIAHHLRYARLPKPGGHAEVCAFMRRVLETPLDPRHPLWEIWLATGVEGDRIAIVPKFSHVAADGVAVLTFLLSLLDATPHDRRDEYVADWTPLPAPGPVGLLAAAAVDLVRREAAILAAPARALTRPDRLAGRVAHIARGAREIAALAPHLTETGPVGSRRDFGWVALPLAEVRRMARAHEVTVNDVVLAYVAEALGARMTAAGLTPDGARPRVIVPVSTHPVAGTGGFANAFSLMVVPVPVGAMPLQDRLRAVHRETARAKASGQAAVASLLLAIASVVPPAVLRPAAPWLLRHQPFVNLAVTDLVGSPVPLFLLGSPMLEAYPFITLTGNLGIIVGVLSHDQQLCIGVTTDPDLVEDVDAFVTDIAAAAGQR